MIDLLKKLLDAWPATIRAELVSSREQEGLLERGLIQAAGAARTVLCTECDQPHDVLVKPFGEDYRYFCRDLGYRVVSSDSIQLWRLAEDNAALVLSHAFGVATPKWRILNDGRLIWLGWFETELHGESHRVDLCIAIGPLTVALLDALAPSQSSPMKAPATLALTTTEWRQGYGLLPRPVAVATLHEVLSIDRDDGVSVDWRLVRDVLETAVTPPRKLRGSGRPRRFKPEKLAAVLEAVVADGDASDLESASGPTIAKKWRTMLPDEPELSPRRALELKTDFLRTRSAA